MEDVGFLSWASLKYSATGFSLYRTRPKDAVSACRKRCFPAGTRSRDVDASSLFSAGTWSSLSRSAAVHAAHDSLAPAWTAGGLRLGGGGPPHSLRHDRSSINSPHFPCPN